MTAAGRMAAAAAVLAFAAALVLPPPLPAQQRITLAEATREALEKSDLLHAEDARVDGARSDVAAARGHLLPTVTLEERFLRTDNPAWAFSTKINQGGFTAADLQGAPGSFNEPDPTNEFQTSLSISQPLWSRRATLGVEIARSEEEAVAQERARRREEVANRVLQAWLGAQAAEAYLETAARAVEEAEEHARLAAVAEVAGTGLASDRLRAEVALAEARRRRLAVENDEEIARRGLGLAVGREEALAPSASHEPLPPPPELDVLLVAVEARNDLRAVAARAENARRAAGLARAARLPEVGLAGSVQADDPDLPLGTSGTSYAVGIGVTWNVFDGGRASAAEARAQAGARQAASHLAALTKEARHRVRESWLRWKEAAAGIEIARGAETAAAEGVRLIRVRYENGLAPMVALLDAQSALDRARSEVVRARAGVAAALGELRFQAGVPLDEVN